MPAKPMPAQPMSAQRKPAQPLERSSEPLRGGSTRLEVEETSSIVSRSHALTPLPNHVPSASQVASVLNGRFARGAPSERLEDAGVLLHTLDGSEHPNHPWKSERAGDFPIVASLVNARHPDIYGSVGTGDEPGSSWLRGFAGIVYDSSEAAHRQLLALMPVDSFSIRYTCGTSEATAEACVPGKPPQHCTELPLASCIEACRRERQKPFAERRPCLQHTGMNWLHWDCHYKPSELRSMMLMQSHVLGGETGPYLAPSEMRMEEHQFDEADWQMWAGYNEIVLASGEPLRRLVQAVFVRAPGVCTQTFTQAASTLPETDAAPPPKRVRVSCGWSPADLQFALDVQARLRADGIVVPVLTYNRSSATSPFQVLRE